MSQLLPARAVKAVGHAATRCFEPTAKLAAANYIWSQDIVYTKDAGAVWTIGWAFWTTSNNSESYLTGNTSFSAAIEYPVGSGNWTYANECPGGAPITFDMGGTNKLCLLTFNKVIPRGKAVKIRALQDSATANGVFWRQGQSADQAHPLQGMSGPSNGARPGLLDAFSNFGEYSFPPVLVATQTRQPSALLFHDSREECASDGPRPPFYDNGLVSPALAAAGIGYSQMGHSGLALSQFLAGTRTQRMALAPYFTHVGNLYGINDLVAQGRSAAQLLADDATFAALFPNNEVFTDTFMPALGTTDGFATLANQSITAANLAKVKTVNEGRRAGVVGNSFCLDVIDKLDPLWTYKWPIDRNPALASRATGCQFTGSISGTTLTVTAISSGSLNVNDPIVDKQDTSTDQKVTGCTIQEQLTGSAGSTGTYRISRPQTLTSRTLYVGGYGASDGYHQAKDLSEQVKARLIPDVLAAFQPSL